MKLKRQTYFHAMALFIIARRKQAEVDGLQKEIWQLLEIPANDQGVTHIDDAIYTRLTNDEERDFNEAMKKTGFTWETPEEEVLRVGKVA